MAGQGDAEGGEEGDTDTDKDGEGDHKGDKEGRVGGDEVAAPPPPWATTLATLCLKRFSSLPKAGKPVEGQWTVVACTAVVRGEEVELTSLATGTKCLGGAARRAMAAAGSLLHDSHAEVLARRGLLLWLLEQVEAGGTRWVEQVEGGWRLAEGWQVVMLTSHPPCGDATIAPRAQGGEEELGAPCAGSGGEPNAKKRRLEGGDIHRTGGKVVQEGAADPEGEGAAYHALGVLRTKPGRGPRTLSLSCSDKMLKWNLLGLQGALLSHLYPTPIHLHALVLAGAPLDRPALARALWERGGKCSNRPALHAVPLAWGHAKAAGAPACPDSVVWVAGGKEGHREALTAGHRQGWANKKLDNPKSWSLLCRRSLAGRVAALAPLPANYTAAKAASPLAARKEGRGPGILDLWPLKPQEDFSLAS